MNYQTAVFGGGCFWCLEAIFLQIKGVKSVQSGYAGGFKEKPSYKNRKFRKKFIKLLK